MAKTFILTLLLFCVSLVGTEPKLFNLEEEESPNFFTVTDKEWTRFQNFSKKIVLSTVKIELPQFPKAFNPSLIKWEDGYLLSFRYCPDRFFQPWLSYIGVVKLNTAFQPVSRPQLLNTRPMRAGTPSQSEDARLFVYNGKTYLIYNDNMDVAFPALWERRDMYIAELLYEEDRFSVSNPVRLIHKTKCYTQLWQKNWVPFEHEGALYLSYTINPHEVLAANFVSGICDPVHETNLEINWALGPLRGSTPPVYDDGEYIAFFHSGVISASPVSGGEEIWHYFMGAYTFSPFPPFELSEISPLPIVGQNFYTQSDYEKRVIFPGGCVIEGGLIYVAYGKDDCEMWIATLDKNKLKSVLVPIEKDLF